MMTAPPASAPPAALALLPGASAPGATPDAAAADATEFDGMLGPLGVQAEWEPAEAGTIDIGTGANAVQAPVPSTPVAAPNVLFAAMLDALSLRAGPVPESPSAVTTSEALPEAPVDHPIAALLSQRDATPRGPYSPSQSHSQIPMQSQSPSQLLAAMLALRTTQLPGGVAGTIDARVSSAVTGLDPVPEGDNSLAPHAGLLELPAPTAAPVAAVAPGVSGAPVASAVAGPALPPGLASAIPDPDAAQATIVQPPPSLASGAEAPIASVQNPMLAASAEPRVDNAALATGVAAPIITSSPHAGAQAPRGDGVLPQIVVPFDSPQWGNELASRVVTMSREQFSQAQIRVTPDELGPIEITLRFDGEKVHAQFGAVSPEAREALTSNMHRLREMLSSEGLNLGQSFVGHQGSGERRTHDRDGFRLANDSDEFEHGVVGTAAPVASRIGLLDEFA